MAKHGLSGVRARTPTAAGWTDGRTPEGGPPRSGGLSEHRAAAGRRGHIAASAGAFLSRRLLRGFSELIQHMCI